MPTLAGWLTGEQVPQEIIEQVLSAMGATLERHGGQPARTLYPGAGLITFSDAAYAMRNDTSPPVLDWVPDRRTLVYRRPLSGWHPLYYITDWPAQGNLLFASEIKALLAVGAPRRLHLPALAALLRYGFIPAPWTPFKNIQVVPAGSILRWQRAKTVLNHAVDYQLDETHTSTSDILLQELAETCNNQLPLHEHLVALTNGNDASALATVLSAQQTQTPFPIVMLGNHASLEDSSWQSSQRVADLCERPFLAVTGVDQPEFWTATLAGTETPCIDTRSLALHQLLHTTATETGARVAICGLGASSALKKVEALYSANISDPLALYAATRKRATSIDNMSLWSEETKKILQTEEAWETTLHARKLARRAEQFSSYEQQYSYLNLHLHLPDALVTPMYQLAVQERIALRSPYLDHHLLDTLTRLPALLDDGARKTDLSAILLQRLMQYPQIGSKKEVLAASSPTSSSSQTYPNGSSSLTPGLNPAGEITTLALPTFSFQDVTTELYQQTLSPEALRKTGIFHPQTVALLQQMAAHGRVSHELLLVFTTQLISQLFDVPAF